MNPTRELITDLLPAYFSGEASADTHALVEQFFAQDPEFERMARRLAGSLNALRLAAPAAEEELERRALMRTRMQLRGKNVSLGIVFAGILGILLLLAIHSQRHSAPMSVFIVVVGAALTVYALLANRTRNSGL